MKNRIVVRFSKSEIDGMKLRNGPFSLTRFKTVLRKKLKTDLLSWLQGRGEAGADFSIARISVRDVDTDRPKDFRVEIFCSSGGKTRWRQDFRYEFDDPRSGLGGALIPGSRHNAK